MKSKKPPLSDTHPDLIVQWHPTKNTPQRPENITAGSAKKLWWKCPEGPDHEWQAAVNKRSSGQGCPYCAGHKVFITTSLSTLYPEIASQWHPEKNGELTPDSVVAGSGKKAWWRCPKGPDHEWQARINHRTAGVGCPFCSGRRASVTNSITSMAPEIAEQWHPIKNGQLTPEMLPSGSSKKVWWKCPKGPDHEWQAPPCERLQGRGCPFCVGKRVSVTNSLQSLQPDLVQEWHPIKNHNFTPDMITASSNRSVWWKCPEGPDHEWKSPPGNRSQGKGCPYCSGQKVSITNSLSNLFPEIASQWHPTKNDNLKPDRITSRSNRSVWWKCPNGPDHEWKSPPNRRVPDVGCPFCASRRVSITNSLATLYPEIADEWHPSRNANLTPEMVVVGSNKKVWWKCPEGPDHEWLSQINNRTLGKGCPFCAGHKVSITNSLASLYPEIAVQWHREKNDDLTPEMVTAGSGRKYWWKCPEGLDHEWSASPHNRSRSVGCPFCFGRKVSITNSLASLYPEIAVQWHLEKNSDLTPDMIVASSGKKVWWKCPEGLDHEWSSTPYTRIKGHGCPFCSGRYVSVTNSLLNLYPKIASQWHPEKNGEMTPNMFVAGSVEKAWWKCHEGPDHEWEARLSHRINGVGCPYCAGRKVSVTNSLATLYPNLIREWHPDKNDDLTPEMVVAGSSRKVWWKCSSNPEHVWLASVGNRTGPGRGCPYCASGWTLDNIRLFVKSLSKYLQSLTPAELFLLFQQNGLLDSSGKGKAFSNALTTGRIPFGEIEKFIDGKPSIADQFIEDADTIIEEALEGLASGDQETLEDVTEKVIDELETVEEELPTTNTEDALASLEAAVNTISDEEAVKYLLASARHKLWRHALHDEEAAVQQARSFKGAEYAEQVRQRFLDEYSSATLLPIPDGYAFSIEGVSAPPNLMQRLAAVTVRDRKRVGNWSGTGAGKTLSAVLASRVINAGLTVVCCPNSVVPIWADAIKDIYPDSQARTKTFTPVWPDDDTGFGRPAHRYLVLNYEAFQQPDSSQKVADFVSGNDVDFVVVDEIHYAKQRHKSLMSKRKRLVNAMISLAAERNPELSVLGMSATPVINNLQEGKSLLEMITGIAFDDLNTRATVSNCMSLHQKLVTLGIRWLPEYDIQFEQDIVELDCTDYLEEIRILGQESHNILGLEQVLTRAKLPTIRQILRDNPKRTLIYTHYITGIDRILREGLIKDGWRVGFFTGEDKSGLKAFLNGDLDVLIGTGAIGTGVDGLQHVCDQLIVNVLPWTSAEFEQLKGRIYRQGQRSEKVRMFIPVTEAHVNGETWSWCRSKLGRIRFKKSIADAAVDGVVPEGHLRTPEQAYRDLMGWLERLESGGEKIITRPRITVPLPVTDPADVQRRTRQYGDFSRMNNRWNQGKSHKTHQRLAKNPDEWEQYHTLYSEARKTWPVLPYEEMIRWCQVRKDYVIGDFGCGEARLADVLADRHTVYSFDHIAISESVTACDIAEVPLEDEVLDVVIFSLSLMGQNFTDYLREAYRTLRLDGQLHIVESTSRFNNLDQFLKGLKALGFDVVEVKDMWKFTHIRALKSERTPDGDTRLTF